MTLQFFRNSDLKRANRRTRNNNHKARYNERPMKRLMRNGAK